MTPKDPLPTWQTLEEQARYAFREWQIWLVLREKELTQQLNHLTDKESP
jgi:hypothetical protein